MGSLPLKYAGFSKCLSLHYNGKPNLFSFGDRTDRLQCSTIWGVNELEPECSPSSIVTMNSAPDSLIETILERMRAEGGRITQKRIRIVRALTQFDHPASADKIRQSAGLAETDLVTVYRNLEALHGIGAVQRIPLENGTQLFELTAPGEHYHHLICRECHQAERLDLCVGKEVLGRAKAHGYSQITHVMEVYGVCKDCDNHS